MSLGTRWRVRDAGAPHAPRFYVFVAFACLAASAFFGALAFVGDDVAALGWRIAFQLPALMFLAGLVQAAERLARPEQARQRASGWTEKVRRRLIQARFTILALSLGAAGTLSIVRHFVSAERRDICDDVRVLSLTLLFLFYALADLAGQRAFETGSLPVKAVANVAAKPRRRIRRSGLTVEDRRP